MMMTLHLYKVRDTTKDISHPIGFVEILLEEMEIRAAEENANRDDETKVYFPMSHQSFFERIHNNQKWIKGGAADTYETQMAFHEWKQLTAKNFIGVEFHFAPNNMPMREFIDTYCRDMMEQIMSTFDVIYSDENGIKAKLDANSYLQLEKLVDEMGQNQIQ